MAALVCAVLISGALGVAAYAKFTSPNPAKRFFDSGDGSYVLQDVVVASVEVVVILALLLGHRLRVAWFGVMLMFGGFAGYAGYYFLRGESCGCFGTLITLPVWGTFVMDLVIVGLAGGLLLARGVKVPRVGGALVAGGLLGVVGWFFADATRPPTPEEVEAKARAAAEQAAMVEQKEEAGSADVAGNEGDEAGGEAADEGEVLPGRADGFTPMERLLRSELLADVREETSAGGVEGVAYYVFVYDPSCHVCMEKMVGVDTFLATYGAGNGVLGVRKVQKREAERRAGIEYAAWTGSPTVFVVRGGRVVDVTTDEEAAGPEGVFFDLEMGAFEGNFP